MPDLGTLMTAGKVITDLKTIIEKFGKTKPDAMAALSLVSQLQEQMDGLRTQALELQTKYLDLKKKDDENEAWKARTVGIEFFQTPGPAIVYARHGKPPYFCPVCFNSRALNPLQPRGSTVISG